MNAEIIDTEEYKVIKNINLFPNDIVIMIISYFMQFQDIFIESVKHNNCNSICSYKNRIYIADTHNTIQIFDINMQCISSFKSMSIYGSIIHAYDEKLYISNYRESEINVYNTEGKYITSLIRIPKPGYFTIKDDIIYVVRNYTSIDKYTIEGRLIELDFIEKLREVNNILVLELKILIPDFNTIKIYGLDGKYITSFGNFNMVHSVVNINNELYVTEYYENHYLHVFDLDYKLIRKIGNDSIPVFYNPHYITFCDNKIFIMGLYDCVYIFKRKLTNFSSHQSIS